MNPLGLMVLLLGILLIIVGYKGTYGNVTKVFKNL